MNNRLMLLNCLAILFTGCAGEGPWEGAAVTVNSRYAWSEGTIRITSAAFSSNNTPTVSIADSVVAVTRLDDTTVSAAVPSVAAGPTAIRVEYLGARPRTGELETAGFADRRSGPAFGGYMLPLPQSGPSIVMRGSTEIIRLDLESLTQQALPISPVQPACGRGIGASFVSGSIVVAESSGCRVRQWQLVPAVSSMDTISLPVDRFVAALAPGVWLSAMHHQVCVTRTDGAAGTCVGQQEETHRVRFSPDGRIAFTSANNSVGGVAVFDSTGLVYRIAGLRQSGGTVFSQAGDTAFAVGTDWLPSSLQPRVRLLALDPPTGAILREGLALPEPTSTAEDLAGASGHPWLYAILVNPSNGPPAHISVLVFERSSLEPVGRIALPDELRCFDVYCDYLIAIVDAPNRLLYVVENTRNFSTPMNVFRFMLPPAEPTSLTLVP